MCRSLTKSSPITDVKKICRLPTATTMRSGAELPPRQSPVVVSPRCADQAPDQVSDPRPAVGCTEASARAAPQVVLSNAFSRGAFSSTANFEIRTPKLLSVRGHAACSTPSPLCHHSVSTPSPLRPHPVPSEHPRTRTPPAAPPPPPVCSLARCLRLGKNAQKVRSREPKTLKRLATGC